MCWRARVTRSNEAIAELRELARGIHPTLLRDEGLDRRSRRSRGARRSPVTVEGSAGERLPDAVELAAYFLVSEALTNVVKHAAASQATVRIEHVGGSLRGGRGGTTAWGALVPTLIRASQASATGWKCWMRG